MTSSSRITSIRLPVDWARFGWPEQPSLDGIVLASGDPTWAWEPTAPAFGVTVEPQPEGTHVPEFSVDHVVLLVPELDTAIATLSRIDLQPRLRMTISGDRPAAFFRVGTVLEVIEAPVRRASLYGVALTFDDSLESLALRWRAQGLSVGDIKPAVQPGRRIMTVHDLEAGVAVMSSDGPVART